MLAAFLLTVMASFSVADWATLRHYDGVDFWQFWGVTKARTAAGHELGSPYRHSDLYQQTLEQLPSAPGDHALANAIGFRKQPDLTGSPLLYTAFAPLPTDYHFSLTLYRWLQALAFLAATGLLFGHAGVGTAGTRAWLAVALLGASDPLMFDLMVGNVNAPQLLAMTISLLLAWRLRGNGDGRESLTAAALGLLLVVLVLLKPNVGAALLALGLSVLLRSTGRERAFVVAAGALAVLGVLMLTASVFDTWRVWLDWWQLTFRSVGRLSYPLDTGNQSMSLYLATHLGLDTAGLMQALAGFWLAALLIAAMWPLRGSGPLLRRSLQRINELLRDPGCGLAIGIVTMYLLSPLSWAHYYVLGLLPVYWLLRGEKPWSLPSVMGWLALLLMTGLARRIHAISGGPSDDIMFATRVFAWLPLLPGILAKLATTRPSAESG